MNWERVINREIEKEVNELGEGERKRVVSLEKEREREEEGDKLKRVKRKIARNMKMEEQSKEHRERGKE